MKIAQEEEEINGKSQIKRNTETKSESWSCGPGNPMWRLPVILY